MADRSMQHLERVLRECAESGVPDKASPWPAIRDRLGEWDTDGTRASRTLTSEALASGAPTGEGTAADAPRARRPLLVPDRPLGWALAVLSVLIVGLGLYAASGPVRELLGSGPPGPGSAGSGQTVVGTAERDKIERGAGDHTIRALAGNDTVFDTAGRNVAYGGEGDDWMIVSGSVYGGPGEDQLEPFSGKAEANGGPGADVIYAHNDERNTVSCGTGDDTVYFDGKLDSLATDCEKQIPRQFEPPLNVPFDD